MNTCAHDTSIETDDAIAVTDREHVAQMEYHDIQEEITLRTGGDSSPPQYQYACWKSYRDYVDL